MPDTGGYSIHIDPGEMDRLVEQVVTVYKSAVQYMATDLWGHIGREAPTYHGRLAGSFDIQMMDPYTWRIFTMVHYAMFVHEGTGVYGPVGHPIVPVQAQFLRFEWHGRIWFMRSVRGQEANPYIDRAIDTTKRQKMQYVEKALNEVAA